MDSSTEDIEAQISNTLTQIGFIRTRLLLRKASKLTKLQKIVYSTDLFLELQALEIEERDLDNPPPPLQPAAQALIPYPVLPPLTGSNSTSEVGPYPPPSLHIQQYNNRADAARIQEEDQGGDDIQQFNEVPLDLDFASSSSSSSSSSSTPVVTTTRQRAHPYTRPKQQPKQRTAITIDDDDDDDEWPSAPKDYSKEDAKQEKYK